MALSRFRHLFFLQSPVSEVFFVFVHSFAHFRHQAVKHKNWTIPNVEHRFGARMFLRFRYLFQFLFDIIFFHDFLHRNNRTILKSVLNNYNLDLFYDVKFHLIEKLRSKVMNEKNFINTIFPVFYDYICNYLKRPWGSLNIFSSTKPIQLGPIFAGF